MAKVSLVATDLDGTLFYDRVHLLPCDRTSLARLREMHIPIVFATGREFASVTPALDRLSLWDAPDFLLHSGGACIRNMKTKENLTLGVISPQTLCRLYDEYAPSGLTMVLSIGDTMYISKHSPIMERESAVLGRPIVVREDFRNLLTQPNSKLVLNGEPYALDEMMLRIAATPDKAVRWHRSHENYIDCYAANVDKGAALRQLCEAEGIALAETAAIGDNQNDLELLRTAAYAACPADGDVRARAAADYIACRAQDGCFTDFCRHFISGF